MGAGLPEPQMLLRVLDADHAVVLARAAVFLYHPPFALQRAVDYACMPDPVEVFTAPPGWGILRSMHGLLLWLHLDADGPLVAAAGSKTFPRLLLIFEAQTTVRSSRCLPHMQAWLMDQCLCRR